jgi:hypothetical protein
MQHPRPRLKINILVAKLVANVDLRRGSLRIP